jgi:hypothetical protein
MSRPAGPRRLNTSSWCGLVTCSNRSTGHSISLEKYRARIESRTGDNDRISSFTAATSLNRIDSSPRLEIRVSSIVCCRQDTPARLYSTETSYEIGTLFHSFNEGRPTLCALITRTFSRGGEISWTHSNGNLALGFICIVKRIRGI